MSDKTASIFEQASRLKLRFSFLNRGGVFSTEDLWELKLEDLNALAKELSKAVKETEEEDFIKASTTSRANQLLNLRFEIVKSVINTKLEERDAKKEAAAKASRKALLADLIAKKEHTDLESKSIEELKKEFADLE